MTHHFGNAKTNFQFSISYFHSVDFPFINKTYVAVVRMKNEIYFGPNSKYVKVFVLVLSPLNEVRLRLGTSNRLTDQ